MTSRFKWFSLYEIYSLAEAITKKFTMKIEYKKSREKIT
jgi:hypothetical protein